MRILKHDKLKFVVFVIGIIIGIMGGCSNNQGGNRLPIVLELSNVGEEGSEGKQRYFHATTEIKFLQDAKDYSGTYIVMYKLYFHNKKSGYDTCSFPYGNVRFNFSGKKGDSYPYTYNRIQAEGLPDGRYDVYAVASASNGKRHFVLNSDYVEDVCVGNCNSGYSIRRITCNSCVTIGINEKTDIPYSLPVLFSTKSHGVPQNGVPANLWVFDQSAGHFEGDNPATSEHLLNQDGIVRAIFVPSKTGEIPLFASVAGDFDAVRVHVIQDNEESGLQQWNFDCNGHPCTHRKESYPNGPEIKGDGLSIDSDGNHKNVRVEVDVVDDWNMQYDADLNTILNVAKSTLESAVYASTNLNSPTNFSDKHPSGIKVEFYQSDIIDGTLDTWYLNDTLARSLLAQYRNYPDAIHVIITWQISTSDPHDIPVGRTFSYNLFTGDSARTVSLLNNTDYVWSALSKSLGSNSQFYKDSTGCIVGYGMFNNNIEPPLRDSLAGLILAHEIGHALGMTHVCDANLAEDNKAGTWYDTMYDYLYGNIMYPRIDFNHPHTTIVKMSHFLLQSLEDSNDWQEAKHPGDFSDPRFKHIPGHPGLCTRDILGIDNATRGLKGYLMAIHPWSNNKK